MNPIIKLKRLHPDAVVPQYARELDAGFDLVAVEDVIVQPGESACVPTGWAIALPSGWELQIRDRSGVSRKTKLRVSNAPGTIDAGYRGEVGVLIDNVYLPEYEIIMEPESYQDFITEFVKMKDGHVFDSGGNDYLNIDYGEYPHGTYIVRKGERIAQAVLARAPQATFDVVDELDETERGAGGFGSSGTR